MYPWMSGLEGGWVELGAFKYDFPARENGSSPPAEGLLVFTGLHQDLGRRCEVPGPEMHLTCRIFAPSCSGQCPEAQPGGCLFLSLHKGAVYGLPLDYLVILSQTTAPTWVYGGQKG